MSRKRQRWERDIGVPRDPLVRGKARAWGEESIHQESLKNRIRACRRKELGWLLGFQQ